MPKPKRPKRKRRPDLVDRLCKAVEELTAERASRSYGPQWVMVHDVARRLGISDEQATALALERLASPTWPIRRIAGGRPLSFASSLASKTRVRPTRYDQPAAAPLAASSCCRRSVRHRPRHHSIGLAKGPARAALAAIRLGLGSAPIAFRSSHRARDALQACDLLRDGAFVVVHRGVTMAS